MPDEVVFRPDRSGGRVLPAALIFGGFFLAVHVLFLDSMGERLVFTLACIVFIAAGAAVSGRMARRWPQPIVINRSGIRFGDIEARYGVDHVPWGAVAHMDLFRTDMRLPPHLRLALRPGAFRDRVRKPGLPGLGFGLDINIPVSVDATPEVVLETAERFWREAGGDRA